MIEARKPTGTRASRRAASRSERRIGAESTIGLVFGIATTATKPPAAALRVPVSRSSLCSWPGRAQVHVRVDEAREEVLPSPSRTSRRRALERRCADLGDLAAADEHVEAARRCPSRGSSTWAPRIRTSAGGVVAVVELAHAGRHRRGCEGGLRRGASGEQLVEDGHADDDAGLDLLADHGLRRVDHLGGELDAAVDRAGVHEHLARRPGGGRRSGTAAAYSRSDGTKESVMRSFCIRSA